MIGINELRSGSCGSVVSVMSCRSFGTKNAERLTISRVLGLLISPSSLASVFLDDSRGNASRSLHLHHKPTNYEHILQFHEV